MVILLLLTLITNNMLHRVEDWHRLPNSNPVLSLQLQACENKRHSAGIAGQAIANNVHQAG